MKSLSNYSIIYVYTRTKARRNGNYIFKLNVNLIDYVFELHLTINHLDIFNFKHSLIRVKVSDQKKNKGKRGKTIFLAKKRGKQLTPRFVPIYSRIKIFVNWCLGKLD